MTDPAVLVANEWAFARHYRNEATRRSALPRWLRTYNHHRQHSAIDKVPPITRLTNLPGQYSLDRNSIPMPCKRLTWRRSVIGDRQRWHQWRVDVRCRYLNYAMIAAAGHDTALSRGGRDR